MEEKGTARTGAVDTAKKRGMLAWIGAAALVGILTGCLLGLGFYAGGYDRVFPGVAVGGMDLEGRSQWEVENDLDWERLLEESVSVRAGGEELGSFSQSQLGAQVDTAALAEAAWAVGRKPGILGWVQNAWTMLRGKMGGVTELEASATGYDRQALEAAAAELAASFDQEAADGGWELTADGLFAVKGVDGRRLDQKDLVRQLEALEGRGGQVDAVWETVEARPLDLEEAVRQLESEPTPARYDIETGRVVEGRPGIRLDAEAAAFALDAAAPGERVRLPAEIVEPALTARELEAVLFRDVLGTASTAVSGSSVRRGNVKLSGRLINGTVLNDGDEFDYNLVVGERTTARGFGAAPSYVNGETVNTVGGGICQTSSTLYLAAMRSNLEIVERYNHRYWPGYIARGMDATVSWGGPEFRFKNNTGYPVRIEAEYRDSQLTVTLRGTKTDDTYVEMEYDELSTTPYETEYRETAELPWGVRQQQQSGYTGREVVTYRCLYSGDGELLSRTEEARSSYKSRSEIILVGTAGKPEEDKTSGQPEEEGLPGASGEPDLPPG